MRLVLAWLASAVALLVAAGLVPGAEVRGFGGALVVAALIAVLNAVLPPVLAALRLPFMLATGFLLVLVADALLLSLAHAILPDDIRVDSFGWAFLAALVIAAVSMALQVVVGANDDDTYTLRVTRRIARRQGAAAHSDVPGIVFLEIDGLALPVLRDAMRDGSAPEMARWVADDGYRLLEWEPDLSSQTGRQPGRDPARLQRGHPRVPLGREGDADDDRLLLAGRLRRDRAAPRHRARPAGRRRREPRQPALRRGGRGDPHRQPHRRREGRQPGLPRVPRQRLQRHPDAGPVRVGDRARGDRRDARRAAATCGRAATAAGSIRSCARRCPCSSATWSSSASSRT